LEVVRFTVPREERGAFLRDRRTTIAALLEGSEGLPHGP
jgi:hypothetical protein